MFKKIILSMALLISLSGVAHEGHLVPGAIKANHGGTVLAGKDINLEYVVSGTEVKLFPVSHEGNDLTATEVNLSAKAKMPTGKPESVKLESKDGAFVTTVDFKKAYRLEMNVDAVVKGKKNSFKFQIEK